MKRLLFVMSMLVSTFIYAQVGIGTTTPDNTAALDINSTTTGLLIPRMTQAQRIAIVTPAMGLLVYETDTAPGFWYYDGTIWTSMSSDTDWTIAGADMYNANTGNIGIGVTTPTRKLHIENGIANNSVLYAENTDTSTSYSYGIHGVTNATDQKGAAGVFGESKQSGDHEIGVKGDYSLWGAAVAGIAWATAEANMPTLTDMGVYGGVDYFSGVGVYGLNLNTSATAYGMYCDGNHAITGTKSASVPTTKGNQLLYSMESPEIWFEDIGYGKLVNGITHIALDNMFMETVTIDSKHPMHVFLQEQGDSNGLFVTPDADGKGFTVKEKQGGSSNIAFSFRIMAKRRFYQDHRFGVDSMQAFGDNLKDAEYHEPRSTNPQEVKALIEKGRAEKEAKHKHDKQKIKK